MKSNKKINYFVSLEEFKETNKNPFIAGILSIFLGIFGLHRFYLKRKGTGFIILIIYISSLIFSKVNLAVALTLIFLIEGIVYIVKGVVLLKEKHVKKKTKKDINNEGKNKMDVKEKVTETKGKEETNGLEIIDVSNIKSSKIPNRDESDNIFKTNWIKKLELPYERGVMEVVQVKEETINLYENLCSFIDRELEKDKSSLNKEARRIRLKGGYYNNILYTIYCISEGHVTKGYSGSYDYYDPEFSYRILEEHLGKGLRNKVFDKAQKLEEDISPPNSETLKYFNLTENGLPVKWWDRDGSFRSIREFSKKELNILNITPARNTKVWELYEVKKQIIALYLEIWKVISNSLEKNLKWKNKNKATLKNIIDGKYRYFVDYENGNILASLLKISENAIRENMPNTQILDIHKEKDNIKRYLPSELVKSIDDKIVEYKESITNDEIKDIVRDMIENDPNDWRLKVEEILMADDDRKIDILIDYKEDENFIKIVREIIKNTEDEKLLLLCLYGIEREEGLSQKNIKLLKNIIHPSNISAYKNILKSKEALSLDLLNKLVELKNPVRKKIELDMGKVKESKEELNETVEIVKQYIGDGKEDEEFEKGENLEEENDELEFTHDDFLKLILNKGVLDIEKGKKIAMDNGTLLNAFISDVNRELYEYIQDQAIIIEDDYIKIDDFYVDMIKELVMNEK